MAEFSTSMPIADYQQAVWRLAEWEVSEKYTPEQLALALSMVADIFWYSEAKVLHDTKRAARAVSRETKPRRRPWEYERRAVF